MCVVSSCTIISYFMSRLKDQISDFTSRIRQALLLRTDDALEARATLLKWASENLKRLNDVAQKKEDEGLWSKLWKKPKDPATSSSAKKDLERLFNDLLTYLNVKIPNDFTFPPDIDVPQQEQKATAILKDKSPDLTSCQLTGPLLGTYYLSKQKADKLLTLNQQINNLKFNRIAPELIHKCQRLLVRELLGRVFRDEGTLCVVVQVMPVKETVSPTYYLIQDTKIAKSFNVSFGDLKYNQERETISPKGDQKTVVNEDNFIEVLISELMTLQLETFTSQFGCIKEKKDDTTQIRIVKYFDYKSQNQSKYAGLLSSLFFSKQFLTEHEFPIEKIQRAIYKFDTFHRYFSSIQILIDMKKRDFEAPLTFGQKKTKTPSLLFTQENVYIINNIFHNILVITEWLNEVVKPIRKSITLSAIIGQIFPILNFVSIPGITTPQEYSIAMNNRKIDYFISERIDKNCLNAYLDTYLPLDVADLAKSYVYHKNMFDTHTVFQHMINQIDLQNYKAEQAVFLVQIFVHNNEKLPENKLPPQWKDVKVWRKLFTAIEKNLADFSMIDVGVQMAPYYLGLDPAIFGFSDYFHLIKNTQEEPKKLQDIVEFCQYLNVQFKGIVNERIEELLEKCFMYRKVKIAAKIMETFPLRKLRYNNLIDMMKDDSVSMKDKNRIISILQKNHPSRYRKFRWEQIFLNCMQKTDPKKQYTAIQTFDFGECYISNDILKSILRRDGNLLTLQTRNLNKQGDNVTDYMYTLKHDVTKIEAENMTLYVEQTQTPGFDYFFGKLLQTLDISYIKPYTTYFTLHNHVLQFTEHLPEGTTSPYAFKTYSEEYLNNLIEKDVLTEAIIVSLLINPSLISFDDIILKVFGNKFHFYIKSFESYNAYAYTTIEPKLKMKNALLLFAVMNESVSPAMMRKYAGMNVAEKIRDLYNKLRYFCVRMQEMQSKEDPSEGAFKYKIPFLAIPFEKDFIVRFSERFQRISDIFQKNLKQNTTVTHFDILEKISPVVGIYYRCLSEMNLRLTQKWDVIEKINKFKISFVESNLFQFFASFSQYQILEQSYYPNNLQKLQFVGVSQCLQKLKEEQSKNAIFSNQSQQDIINLLLNEDGTNIQFFMRNIDMRLYTEQTQKFLLDIYRGLSVKHLTDKKYRPLESFYLIGCSIIQQKTLNDFGFERIIYMVLQNSSVITEVELRNISQKLKCLTYLRLQKIHSLAYLASTKLLNAAFSEPIKFSVLTTLVINMCQSLIYVDIQCAALTNIDLKRNNKLQSVYVNSRSLKKISSVSNPQLKIQNIGFYAFIGADIYIDDKSCHGDMKKIIPQQKDVDYTTKMHLLFLYILQHFEELKTKTNICATMYKTGNLQHNLNNRVANFISSLVNKFVTGNFKMDIQMEKDVFTALVRCFIKNSKLKDITISEIYFKDKESVLNKKLRDAILFCLKSIHQSKETKILKSITFSSVQEKTLDKVFEVSSIFREDDHLSITIKKYEAHAQKYNNILYSLGDSEPIHKIKLSIMDTSLEDSLFKQICDRVGHKLYSLELVNCQKMVSCLEGLSDVQYEKCKSLAVMGCEFNNLSFITSFKNIHQLEISSCNINDFVALLFSINQLKQLGSLKLGNLFHSSVDVAEFVQNMSHSRISILDLSNNVFEGKDLQMIDGLLSKLSITQFILTNWTLKDTYNFSKFLVKSKIKKVSIYLKDLQSINQFISSLAKNETIMSAQIVPGQQYTAYNLTPFRDSNNKNIEQLTLNIKLPLWLVDILNENSSRKVSRTSKIYPFPDKKAKIFDITSSSSAFKVGLSLDGGGMRGLLLASELHYLCQKMKRPLHEIFDWIGGTSIGGILALAATGTLNGKQPICTTWQMKNLFNKYGGVIFEKKTFQFIANLLGAKYPGTGIEGVLSDYFKSCKLSDVFPVTNCVVTSVKRMDNSVKIFNSKEAKLNIVKDFYMRDVARATSAAPIFFPSAEIKNVSLNKDYSLIDGGVGQNNPSKIVIQELRKSAFSAGTEGKYFLLSLGTGKTLSQSKVIPQNAGYRNLEPIIDSFMESNSYFIQKDLYANHKSKYSRISPILKLTSHDLKLDNTDPYVLRQYENIGEQAAEEAFSSDSRFGPYGDRSLVEWLEANTRLKNQ